jgi:hypothetical protein
MSNSFKNFKWRRREKKKSYEVVVSNNFRVKIVNFLFCCCIFVLQKRISQYFKIHNLEVDPFYSKKLS